MGIARLKYQLECSECCCEIYTCDNCQEYFEEGETISCLDDYSLNHFCSEKCRQESVKK